MSEPGHCSPSSTRRRRRSLRAGSKPRGRLRISAPLLFSQTAMGKLAAAFALKYPEVRLEVTTEDRAVDMVEEGYDLVIRVNPDPDESLVGRIFLRDRLVVVASPDLARPTGGLAVPAVMRGASDRRRLGFGGATRKVADRDRSRSSPVVAHHGPRCGPGGRRRRPPSGVAGQSRPRRRQAGALGRVEGPEIALWTLYPSRRLLSARVSAFLDFLK